MILRPKRGSKVYQDGPVRDAPLEPIDKERSLQYGIMSVLRGGEGKKDYQLTTSFAEDKLHFLRNVTVGKKARGIILGPVRDTKIYKILDGAAVRENKRREDTRAVGGKRGENRSNQNHLRE